MKKLTLSQNHVLILLTVLSAFFCITLSSCSNDTIQLQNLGTSITKLDTQDDKLNFEVSGSFEPHYFNAENIEPFRMRIAVFAQSEKHPTMRKIIHLSNKDFVLENGKMVLNKRILTFPNKVTKQASNDYILKQDVIVYRFKK